MQPPRVVLVLGLALAGCASGAGAGSGGPSVVDVIAVPPYIAFEVPTCAFNLAVAAPLAALSQVAKPWPPVDALYPKNSDAMVETRRGLNDDVANACRPP